MYDQMYDQYDPYQGYTDDHYNDPQHDPYNDPYNQNYDPYQNQYQDPYQDPYHDPMVNQNDPNGTLVMGTNLMTHITRTHMTINMGNNIRTTMGTITIIRVVDRK